MYFIIGFLVGAFITGLVSLIMSGWTMPWQASLSNATELFKRYRLIFEKSPIGVFFCDKNGTGQIINANEAFCTLLGYTPRELYDLKWSDIIYPEDLSTSTHQLFLPDMKPEEELQRKIRFIHRDGTIIYTQSCVRALHVSGVLLYYICHIFDRTDTHLIKKSLTTKTAELSKLQERLARADAALQRLSEHTNSLISSSGISVVENIDSSYNTP